MAFGRKVGSIGELKKSLKKKTGTFIKYIPKEKDGTITVRFLEEPETWISFQEVFDQVKRASYPVPDEGMPGFPSGDDRVSTRYLANAIDTEADKVIPLQLPKDLANQLVVRYEKYGTICDRDYELGRSGAGLDTTYYLTPESPTTRKVDKYEALDLEQVLEDAYNNVWGDDVEDKPAVKSKVTAGAAAKRRAQVEEVEDEPDDLDALATAADDEDDADAQERLTELADAKGIDTDDYETWAEVADALSEATVDGTDEAPEPDEDDGTDADDEPEEGDGEEGGDFYTREELTPMPIGELRAIARDNSIVTTGLSKAALIDALLGGGEEEEPFE